MRSGDSRNPASFERAQINGALSRCSGGRMETLVSLNCSTVECTSPTAPIWQDILAQAVTGELMAAMNYASLSEICDDPAEVADALEHAQIERGHAARFAAEG